MSDDGENKVIKKTFSRTLKTEMKSNMLRSFTYILWWYNVIDEYIQKEKERPSHMGQVITAMSN